MNFILRVCYVACFSCAVISLAGCSCGENEEIVSCAKPKWCNTCDIRGNCKLAKCRKGCDCKQDYYRNKSGVCKPKEFCEIKCPDNEDVSGCPTPCSYCRYQYPNGCPIRVICKTGCDCIDGFSREDETGLCIPTDQC